LALGEQGSDAHLYSSTLAMNDPIFILHHVNLEKIYSQFQHENPHLAHSFDGKIFPGPSNIKEVIDQKKVELYDIMPGFNAPVSKSISDGCHSYRPCILENCINKS
jgi:hypothetical protein